MLVLSTNPILQLEILAARVGPRWGLGRRLGPNIGTLVTETDNCHYLGLLCVSLKGLL